MKRIIIFVNLIFAIIAYPKTKDDKNINVALETVLEFDGKQIDADKQFLNSMQGFLQKIKTAIGTQTKAHNKGGIEMKDFMKQLFSALGGLSKKEMELISKTIKSEIKRRYDTDDNFKELVKIPIVRRSLNSGIETLENAPRNLWLSFARSLDSSSGSSDNNEKESPNMRSTFQNWSKNIISWLSNIFPTRQQQNMPRNVCQIIDDLKNYTKQKSEENTEQPDVSNIEDDSKQKKEKEIDEALRDPEKLVKIVKDALRTLLFDKYVQQEDKKRIRGMHDKQTHFMDPNAKTKVKVVCDKERLDPTTTTERSVKMRTTKKHSKTRNRHEKKKRFEIKHTTRQTRTPKHSWSGSDEGETYKNILRMQPETKDSQTSLKDTEEDAVKHTEEHIVKHTEEDTIKHASTTTTPSKISNEVEEKSIGWSSEKNDDSSGEQKTTTSRTFKTTGTSPRTEKPPKKITTKKPKKNKPKLSVESEAEDSGYSSQSKNIKRIRKSKKKTTTTEKATTTSRATTRRSVQTTTEQTSLESQSAEKSTTTEKSLMDSLREIITDDQPTFDGENEKEPSKETKEASFESSKEKPEVARETKPKKKQSEEEKRNISKSKSSLQSQSVEENRSDTEKESKENHKKTKKSKSLKSKRSKESKKLDTLESWSEVESNEQQKNEEELQKKDNSSNKSHKKRNVDKKEQVRDITKENKSEDKMDSENKSDFDGKKKKEQVIKPESDEEKDSKLALRMSGVKKQKSKKGKETTTATTTRTTKTVSRTKVMFPHVRVIEENIAKISVVKEDEAFTDHSEEKKRAKQFPSNLSEKKNEDPKISESKSQKWLRSNRALSAESTQAAKPTPSRNVPKTGDSSKLNNVQKDHNNQRAPEKKTTDTVIINSKVAPYTEKVETNNHNQTIKTAELKNPGYIGGEKLALSAESEALFRALEEQEQKHGIDNLLDNSDLIDLQNLNISFYTVSSKGRSTVTLPLLPTNHH